MAEPAAAPPSLARRGAGSATRSTTLDGDAASARSRASSSTPSSGEPAWLIVQLGRRRSDPPGRGAAARLRRRRRSASGSPTTREALRSAPVVDPTRPLLREHELTICAHYGIGERVGRAAEVAGRPAAS